MELRKVQLTGGSSISVTLPKTWTERVGIHPGDLVSLHEQPGGGLAIHTHTKGERPIERYVIDFVPDEGRDHLFREIIAAYLMGYDAIVIKSKSPLSAAARQSIRNAVRRIMGLEIVEEEAYAITVQDFLDPREFHIEKALRRMVLLTQAMQEEALGSLKEPKEDALRSAEDRDDEVDKLYWLINKQYHAMLRDATRAAKMDLTASQGLNYLLAARLVERIADHADRMTAQAFALPQARGVHGFAEKVEKVGRKAMEIFANAVQSFLKPDAKKAQNLIDEASRFQDHVEKLHREAATLGGEAVAHLSFILESVGRTAAYAADIAEVAINHHVAGFRRSPEST